MATGVPGTLRGYWGSMLERLRGRARWLDTTLDVHARVGAVGGGAQAAAIALSGFLSLFPLLLVAVAVVGVTSSADQAFTADVIDRLGLTGDAAGLVTDAISSAESTRATASVVGLTGLVWSGLGVVGSLAAASNAVWQTAGGGLLDRVRGLVWLAGAGAMLICSLALSAAVGLLPALLAPLPPLLGVGLDVVLFLWTFTILAPPGVGWRSQVRGAIVAGIGFGVAKLAAGLVLAGSVASNSALYGGLGVVFAVLGWLTLCGRLVIYAMAANVVLYEARRGTLTVGIEVPHLEGVEPVAADRGGAVVTESGDTESGDTESGDTESGDTESGDTEAPGPSVTGRA